MKDFFFTGMALAAIGILLLFLALLSTLPYILAVFAGGWLLKACGILS